MSEIRTGVRLAVDWGKARIGVAACDALGVLAYPVETVPNDGKQFVRLAELAAEYDPIEIVMGLPTALSGKEELAAQQVREAAAGIRGSIPQLPIRLVDERMTTRVAASRLGAAGKSSRKQRRIIDQAAAVALLESALESERNTGRPPGEEYE